MNDDDDAVQTKHIWNCVSILVFDWVLLYVDIVESIDWMVGYM